MRRRKGYRWRERLNSSLNSEWDEREYKIINAIKTNREKNSRNFMDVTVLLKEREKKNRVMWHTSREEKKRGNHETMLWHEGTRRMMHNVLVVLTIGCDGSSSDGGLDWRGLFCDANVVAPVWGCTAGCTTSDGPCFVSAAAAAADFDHRHCFALWRIREDSTWLGLCRCDHILCFFISTTYYWSGLFDSQLVLVLVMVAVSSSSTFCFCTYSTAQLLHTLPI